MPKAPTSWVSSFRLRRPAAPHGDISNASAPAAGAGPALPGSPAASSGGGVTPTAAHSSRMAILMLLFSAITFSSCGASGPSAAASRAERHVPSALGVGVGV